MLRSELILSQLLREGLPLLIDIADVTEIKVFLII